MLYLNSVREEIKAKYPGLKVTEVVQKGGEMWKELKDKSKWEEKAAQAKEEYLKAMEEYKVNSSGTASKESKEKDKKNNKKKEVKKESPSKPVVAGSFKSKEYISDESSSDESSKSVRLYIV
jgi:structure-specific recognition protein 1